jgi:hypothetical protein
MGKRLRVYDPLDLEIIDRVYEVAWAQFVAGGPLRDTSKDGERQEALRRWLFDFAGPGPVDFDTLCDKVLPHWTTSPEALESQESTPDA